MLLSAIDPQTLLVMDGTTVQECHNLFVCDYNGLSISKECLGYGLTLAFCVTPRLLAVDVKHVLVY